jgi:PST family polysaccharide transporter
VNAVWVRLLPSALRGRLDGRVAMQRAIGNTGWLFADRILRMGLGLVVTALVTRYLGPGQFGSLVYATALASLLGSLANLGLDGIVVRDIVRAPDRTNESLGTAFALKALGGVLTVLFAVGIVSLLRPHDTTALALVAVISAGTIIQAFDTVDFWFQSQVQAKYIVYARSFAFVVMSGVRIGLIYLRAPLLAFAWAFLAELLLSAVGMAFAYRLVGEHLSHWRVRVRRARELLTDSWPLVLSGLAIGVYMKIDTLMLGDMVGDAAAGIYGAATRISEVWYFIPATIIMSVAPSITAAKRRGDAVYYARLERLFLLLASIAFAIAIPLTFLSGPIVHLLYGPNYADAAPVLVVHIWAAVFVSLGMGQGCWFVNEELTHMTLSRTLTGAAVNVGMNLVLIPRHGALGAAIATVVSYALSAVVLNAFDKRTTRIFRLQADALLLKGLLW